MIPVGVYKISGNCDSFFSAMNGVCKNRSDSTLPLLLLLSEREMVWSGGGNYDAEVEISEDCFALSGVAGPGGLVEEETIEFD